MVATSTPDPERIDRFDAQLRAIYRDIWDLERKRDALIALENNKELHTVQVRISALREQARVLGGELDVLVAALIEQTALKQTHR